MSTEVVESSRQDINYFIDSKAPQNFCKFSKAATANRYFIFMAILKRIAHKRLSAA